MRTDQLFCWPRAKALVRCCQLLFLLVFSISFASNSKEKKFKALKKRIEEKFPGKSEGTALRKIAIDQIQKEEFEKAKHILNITETDDNKITKKMIHKRANRIYFFTHPDKNLDKKEEATELFKFIQLLVDRSLVLLEEIKNEKSAPKPPSAAPRKPTPPRNTPPTSTVYTNLQYACDNIRKLPHNQVGRAINTLFLKDYRFLFTRDEKNYKVYKDLLSYWLTKVKMSGEEEEQVRNFISTIYSLGCSGTWPVFYNHYAPCIPFTELAAALRTSLKNKIKATSRYSRTWFIEQFNHDYNFIKNTSYLSKIFPDLHSFLILFFEQDPYLNLYLLAALRDLLINFQFTKNKFEAEKEVLRVYKFSLGLNFYKNIDVDDKETISKAENFYRILVNILHNSRWGNQLEKATLSVVRAEMKLILANKLIRDEVSYLYVFDEEINQYKELLKKEDSLEENKKEFEKRLEDLKEACREQTYEQYYIKTIYTSYEEVFKKTPEELKKPYLSLIKVWLTHAEKKTEELTYFFLEERKKLPESYKKELQLDQNEELRLALKSALLADITDALSQGEAIERIMKEYKGYLKQIFKRQDKKELLSSIFNKWCFSLNKHILFAAAKFLVSLGYEHDLSSAEAQLIIYYKQFLKISEDYTVDTHNYDQVRALTTFYKEILKVLEDKSHHDSKKNIEESTEKFIREELKKILRKNSSLTRISNVSVLDKEINQYKELLKKKNSLEENKKKLKKRLEELKEACREQTYEKRYIKKVYTSYEEVFKKTPEELKKPYLSLIKVWLTHAEKKTEELTYFFLEERKKLPESYKKELQLDQNEELRLALKSALLADITNTFLSQGEPIERIMKEYKEYLKQIFKPQDKKELLSSIFNSLRFSLDKHILLAAAKFLVSLGYEHDLSSAEVQLIIYYKQFLKIPEDYTVDTYNHEEVCALTTFYKEILNVLEHKSYYDSKKNIEESTEKFIREELKKILGKNSSLGSISNAFVLDEEINMYKKQLSLEREELDKEAELRKEMRELQEACIKKRFQTYRISNFFTQNKERFKEEEWLLKEAYVNLINLWLTGPAREREKDLKYFVCKERSQLPDSYRREFRVDQNDHLRSALQHVIQQRILDGRSSNGIVVLEKIASDYKAFLKDVFNEEGDQEELLACFFKGSQPFSMTKNFLVCATDFLLLLDSENKGRAALQRKILTAYKNSVQLWGDHARVPNDEEQAQRRKKFHSSMKGLLNEDLDDMTKELIQADINEVLQRSRTNNSFGIPFDEDETSAQQPEIGKGVVRLMGLAFFIALSGELVYLMSQKLSRFSKKKKKEEEEEEEKKML